MRNLRTLVLAGLALAGSLFLSLPVTAATLTLNPGSPVDGITWSISGITPGSSAVLTSAFYDDNVTPQDPASIGTVVGGWFSLTLTLVTNVDELSGATYTYSGPAADVFAIHLGQAEFAFLFSAPVTGFTFTEDGKGLSNLRAYCSTASCDPGATPLPAALPLFAGGLGVLGVLGFRRKRKAIA